MTRDGRLETGRQTCAYPVSTIFSFKATRISRAAGTKILRGGGGTIGHIDPKIRVIFKFFGAPNGGKIRSCQDRLPKHLGIGEKGEGRFQEIRNWAQ